MPDEAKSEIVWFAGLPLVRSRPLEPHELRRLSKVALQLKLRGLLLALAVPLSLLIVTALAIMLDLAIASRPELRTATALFLTALLAIEIGVIVPLATAAAYRSLRRFRLTHVDSLRGEVAVCVGL